MSDKPIVITIDKNIQAILHSFKKINKAIVFNTEETSVVHPEESVIGLCCSFKMPEKIALTSLNRLLSALKWADNDEAEIHENYIFVKSDEDNDTSKSQKVTFHDNFGLIKHVDPGFKDTLGEPACQFDLTAGDIKDIKDANRNLEAGIDNPIKFKIETDKLTITIGDGNTRDECTIIRSLDYQGDTFELIYMPTDFVFIDGDYEVRAYEHGAAVFKLKPIEVDEELIDLELYYFLTSGLNS